VVFVLTPLRVVYENTTDSTLEKVVNALTAFLDPL